MRCNTGVDPSLLFDSWLIAEQVEILMLQGMFRKTGYSPRSPIPPKFCIGTGHMNFWADKAIYMAARHAAVKREVANRGYKVTDKNYIIEEFPLEFQKNWAPTLEDSMVLRNRLCWKMDNKPGIWRYKGVKVLPADIPAWKHKILSSSLYYV